MRRSGWEAAQVSEGVVFIQLAGQVLALFGIEDLAEDMGRPRAELGTGAVTLARNFAHRGGGGCGVRAGGRGGGARC